MVGGCGSSIIPVEKSSRVSPRSHLPHVCRLGFSPVCFSLALSAVLGTRSQMFWQDCFPGSILHALLVPQQMGYGFKMPQFLPREYTVLTATQTSESHPYLR